MLTDVLIRTAKAESTEKSLYDELGLFLFINPLHIGEWDDLSDICVGSGE